MASTTDSPVSDSSSGPDPSTDDPGEVHLSRRTRAIVRGILVETELPEDDQRVVSVFQIDSGAERRAVPEWAALIAVRELTQWELDPHETVALAELHEVLQLSPGR